MADEPGELEILFDERQLAGVWANLVDVAYGRHEFTLDFIRLDERKGRPTRYGVVVARVAMSSQLAQNSRGCWRRTSLRTLETLSGRSWTAMEIRQTMKVGTMTIRLRNAIVLPASPSNTDRIDTSNTEIGRLLRKIEAARARRWLDERGK